MKEIKFILNHTFQTLGKMKVPLLLFALVFESIIVVVNLVWMPMIDAITIPSELLYLAYIKDVIKGMMNIVVFPLGLAVYTSLIVMDHTTWKSGFEQFKRLLPNVIKLLCVGLIWFIGIFVGLELLALPGFFVLFALLFVGPVLVNDKLSLLETFKKSFALLKPKFWIVMIVYVVVLTFQATLLMQIDMFLATYLPTLLATILSLIFTCISSLLVYIPISVMYIKRENEFFLNKQKTKKKKIRQKGDTK